MTRLVQVTLAGDVAEGEELVELLAAAGIESHLEPAIEHDPDALDDPPLKVLVAESDVDEARDAIEALTEPDDLEE
ncbi:MAG: hypothetical protein OEW52_07035 [Thermoleophilia bacterium]|nr:hypothetical protein [Thermoleophilia bacterium]MDH4340098.1 hypothetical protein [Thermoleophilia bacterium]MDH5280892.1 hypothetical protein [Thermoleophilia bacterium]